MKLLICLLAAISISGCACKNGVIPFTPQVHIDSSILTECTPVPAFDVTYDDISVKYVELIAQYGECKNKQSASILTIRELANIKESK